MGNHELTCIEMGPRVKTYFFNIHIVLVLVLATLFFVECKVSDERLCADPDCSEGAKEEQNNEEIKTDDENVPFEAEIQKTEQSEESQIETKQPELNLPSEEPAVEVVSSISTAVESHSVDHSVISTPPIDTSVPPIQQTSVAAPQPVEPNSIVNYEVVDGTTIYFDEPPPKINEAPSLDNTTPEAISPTMTEARAKPTESSKIPEIESSVREQVDVVEKMGGVAVLSDNPGVSNPTGNTKDVTHENVDTTEPITDEIKTASYDRGTNDQEKKHPRDLTEKI